MNQYLNYFGQTLDGYPHGEGRMESNFYNFLGTWDKGLRINSGKFLLQNKILVVQFKKGKIHRLLESNSSIFQDILILNQIHYIKEGNYFKEVFKNDPCYFFSYKSKILFHGYPKPTFLIGTLFFNNFEIHRNFSYTSASQEISGPYQIISRSLNYIPIGRCRVSISDNFYIKGFIIGYFFIGQCKVVHGSLRLSFESCVNQPPLTFQITSAEYGLKINFNRDNSLILVNVIKDDHQATPGVRSFIDESFLLLKEIYFNLKRLPFMRESILYSIQDKDNWINFEINLKKTTSWIFPEGLKRDDLSENLENRKNFDGEQKVVRIRYSDGSKYFGESRNQVKHGLGCFIFPDQSKFQGYFMNDQIMGKGKFYCSKYILKGIWKNSRITEVNNFLII